MGNVKTLKEKLTQSQLRLLVNNLPAKFEEFPRLPNGKPCGLVGGGWLTKQDNFFSDIVFQPGCYIVFSWNHTGDASGGFGSIEAFFASCRIAVRLARKQAMTLLVCPKEKSSAVLSSGAEFDRVEFLEPSDFSKEHPHIWAAYKLDVYAWCALNLKEWIHSDLDVYLWGNLPYEFFHHPLVAQNTEAYCQSLYENIGRLLDRNEDWSVPAVNAGLLRCSLPVISACLSKLKELREKNPEWFERNPKWRFHQSVIVEQALLSKTAKELGISPLTLLEEKDLKNLYLKKIQVPKPYSHLMSFSKHHAGVIEAVIALDLRMSLADM